MPTPPNDAPTPASAATAARPARSRDTILRRLVIFAVVLVLPFLALIGIGFRNKFVSDRANATSLLQARRSTAEQLVNNYLASVRRMLTELDRLPALQELRSPRAKETCALFLQLHPEFINLAVVDRTGNLLFSTLFPVPDPPQNYASLPSVKDVLGARDFQVSSAARGLTTGRWGCVAAVPMTAHPDRLLIAAIDLHKLSDQLFLAPDTTAMVVTVVDRDDTVVLTSRDPARHIGQQFPAATQVVARFATDLPAGEVTGPDGRARTYDACRLDPSGWLVLASLPSAEIYADARANLARALGAIALVVLCSALFVTYYARGIARPVAALAAAARAQAEGRTEILAPVTGPREIAATAQAFNDMIRARQAAELSLRRTEGRLDLALEGAGLGLWEWHLPSGRVTTNAHWAKMLEYDFEEVGQSLASWEELLHPEDKGQVHAILHQHLTGQIELYETEHRLRAKSGRWVWVLDRGRVVERDAAGQPLRVAGTHLDITARKEAEFSAEQLQKKLQETQKLESLGVLAGGIAHDFNNLLTGVLGHASLAKLDLPPGAAAVQNIDQIEVAARRAADLCRQMLAYSGKGHFVIQRLDLNQIVEDSTHLLQISVSKQCVLRTNLARPLPTISADATQVRQIIMNLVINASEAIGARSGVIALATGIVRADANYLRSLRFTPDIPAGDYVFIEISDNGCGMDEATLHQIFDPFFTTKFTGRGLGLAAVLGIMRGHRGGVKVYSEPSRGTTFKMLFPCITGPAEDLEKHLVPQVAWRGRGTVLVVDDEETVRAVSARMLESLGFAVVLAEHGRDGFEKFQLEPDRYSLVLLDLTMPHMDGQETFRQLRALRPAVKILLMSGFNQQEAISRFTGKGLAGFVQKPFELGTLALEIRRVLESPHGNG
ncbi:MAG: response regulator [Opitutae bacterium]|nr:response regulator [Opitutae bacterium]